MHDLLADPHWESAIQSICWAGADLCVYHFKLTVTRSLKKKGFVLYILFGQETNAWLFLYFTPLLSLSAWPGPLHSSAEKICGWTEKCLPVTKKHLMSF